MSNNQFRTALLIGGTGLVGRHCLDLLLAEPIYEKIIMLVRRPFSFTHPKLKVLLVDFDNIEQYSHLLVAEDVYCAIGTTFLKTPKKEDYFRIDFTYPEKIANIVVRNGGKRFALVSALSANPNALLFYSQVKGKLEEAIERMAYESVYIFRPSYLLGNRLEFRPMESVGRLLLMLAKPILIGKLRRYRAIDAKCVAQAMVARMLAGESGIHIYQSDEI